MLAKFLDRFKHNSKNRQMVGLTISDTVLCLVVPPQEQNNDFSSKDLIVKQSYLESAGEIASLLKQWINELSLEGAKVVVTLDTSDYELFQMERPDVDDADLQSATHWKLQDYLNYPVAEAISDIFDVPEARHGHSQQIYVAVAKKQILKHQMQIAQEAGLYIKSINITQLAIRNLIARENINETVGVVFTSDESSQLFICKNDTFFLTRNINVGVRQINACDESSQIQFTDQFSLEIQRTMDYYDSHYDQSPVRKLIFLDRSPERSWLSSSVAGMLGVSLYHLEFFDAQQFESSDLLPIAWGGLLGELRY